MNAANSNFPGAGSGSSGQGANGGETPTPGHPHASPTLGAPSGAGAAREAADAGITTPSGGSVPAPEIAALIKVPTIVTVAVGIIAIVIGGLTEGGKGLLAAVLGAVVVVAFFAGGQYVVGRVLRSNPALGLNTALLVYVVQIAVLFALLLLLRHATFFAPKVFAFTIIACVLAWIIGSIIGFTRTRQPTIEPGSGPPRGTILPLDEDS